MQYHLADPTILYFDSEERNNVTIGRKKSWKGLYQNVSNKIFRLGLAEVFFKKGLGISVFYDFLK